MLLLWLPGQNSINADTKNRNIAENLFSYYNTTFTRLRKQFLTRVLRRIIMCSIEQRIRQRMFNFTRPYLTVSEKT